MEWHRSASLPDLPEPKGMIITTVVNVSESIHLKNSISTELLYGNNWARLCKEGIYYTKLFDDAVSTSAVFIIE
jgi:hypothetical protein